MKIHIIFIALLSAFSLAGCTNEPIEEDKEIINPFEVDDFLMAQEVDDDFPLITSFGGIPISWSSNDTSHIEISNDGEAIVARGDDDVVVTLTAFYTYMEQDFSLEFTIIVLPLPQSNPLDGFIISVPDSVIEDFVLPTTQDGATIEWSSSNTDYLSVDNGSINVTRTSFDISIVLTATISKDGFVKVKHYNVLVIKEAVLNQNELVITFNITLPYPLEEDQYLSMGSNINAWNPGDEDYFATKIDPYTYQLIVELSTIPDVIEYKWTIQDPNNTGVWSKVEKSEAGLEIGNRSVSGNKGESIIVDDIVSNFATDTGGPNSTVVGNLEIITDFEIPQITIHDTTIRIWTPSTYDPDDETTRYPVVYMHDGQNCFDVATSFAGEWGIDETIEDFILNNLHNGAIVVGIDNSGGYRQNTYTPEWDGPGLGLSDNYLDTFPTNEVFGERYGRFIVETLKPYIDENYNTLTDRENTSIAGSSMGGLISFYVGLKYMDIFGSIGVFSPAFQVASESGRQAFISSLDFSSNNLPKVYIDGGELEGDFTRFVEIVANELYDAGLPAVNIMTTIGENQGHNEPAWRARFPNAFLWFFNEEDGNFIPEE